MCYIFCLNPKLSKIYFCRTCGQILENLFKTNGGQTPMMKYLWFILFLLTMACIGMGYILNDAVEFLFKDRTRPSQAEIVVQTPDIQE